MGRDVNDDAPRLSILAAAGYLPPTRPTREVAAELGADPSAYRGWDNLCLAGHNDHPSTMSARALSVALQRCQVDPGEIRLVLFAGMSRDYLPSWSVATEVMNDCGLSSDCIGIDLTVGCLSVLTALEMARGWLSVRGGGHAVIVTAERWAYTVDRSRTDLMSLWGHADGGGALLVGLGSQVRQPSLADFVGAEFTSKADYNGRVLITYGGTRHPVAPPDEPPHQRFVEASSAKQAKAHYLNGYTHVADAVRARFGIQPTRLVCNQISTGIVAMLPDIFGVDVDRVVVSGHDTGHLGPADVIVGLERLTAGGPIDAPTAVASSTAYAFGAGLLVPPRDSMIR